MKKLLFTTVCLFVLLSAYLLVLGQGGGNPSPAPADVVTANSQQVALLQAQLDLMRSQYDSLLATVH